MPMRPTVPYRREAWKAQAARATMATWCEPDTPSVHCAKRDTRTLSAVSVRLAIAGVLLVVALIVAAVAERRKRSKLAPAHRSYDHPRQLDRADFDRPDAPWLVVVFSSAACEGCRPVATKAAVLTSDVVAVSECEFTTQRTLHERYAIEGVPTTVIADADGVVHRGFIGSVSATDLWAAVADLRNPPTEPRVCSAHAHDDPDSVNPTR